MNGSQCDDVMAKENFTVTRKWLLLLIGICVIIKNALLVDMIVKVVDVFLHSAKVPSPLNRRLDGMVLSDGVKLLLNKDKFNNQKKICLVEF